MKRLVAVLSLVLIIAGCSPKLGVRRGPNPESRYLEGYMDGYRSAFPEEPYARDVEPLPRSYPLNRSDRAYDQGWKAGHQTGRSDWEQRK